MMHTLKLFAATILFLLTTCLQAAGTGSIKVIDRGVNSDIKAREYAVMCPDGSRTNVTDYFLDGKVCGDTPKADSGRTCRQGWSIDDAAKYACDNL